jgi:hypothetical protein
MPSLLSEPPIHDLTEPAQETPQTFRQRRWMVTAVTGVGLMMVVLATGCIYFWIQYRTLRRSLYAWQYEPSVSALWTNILNASPDTDMVLADASFGLLQDLNKRSFFFRRLPQPQLYQRSLGTEFEPGDASGSEPHCALEPG